MATARFKRANGTLSAELLCEPSRDGSYDLRLWDRDLNNIVKEWRGSFRNTDSDRRDLPDPAAANDGRDLEAQVLVALPTGVTPSTVSLVVRQQSTELARDSRLLAPGNVDQVAQLWVDLECED